MDINWLGHSCFRIKGSHATVVTDPYPPELGYTLGQPEANIVTVSHQHPDHSYIQDIGGAPRVVSGPGEYEISGVFIIGLPTFHDAEDGKSRGKNTIYVMEIDTVSVCHLGDIGHMLTTGQMEEMGNVDVLMLPVGGQTTIDAVTAAKLVRQLEPKIVIPMHYKTDLVNRDLEPVTRFLQEMGVQEISPQPKLSITKANLPLITKVVLLDY